MGFLTIYFLPWKAKQKSGACAVLEHRWLRPPSYYNSRQTPRRPRRVAGCCRSVVARGISSRTGVREASGWWTPILLRGDHGLTSRASVASRSGNHEGECFGEVGGARVSAGGQSRLEDEKGRGVSGEVGLGTGFCSATYQLRGSGP